MNALLFIALITICFQAFIVNVLGEVLVFKDKVEGINNYCAIIKGEVTRIIPHF